jgi:putative inorganic carbon (HCO3(-)) transporter
MAGSRIEHLRGLPSASALRPAGDTPLWYALLVVLVLAPLPAASVSPLAQAALTFVLFMLLLFLLIRRAPIFGPSSPVQGRIRLLMLCWMLAVLVAVLQVVPLPPDLIAWFSPSVSDLYGWSLPLGTEGHWRAFSTTPGATIQSGLFLGACAAVFMLVIELCRTRRRMLLLALTIVLLGATETLVGLARTGASVNLPASGTFVNRNHFAAFLAMGLGLSLGLLLARWEEKTDQLKTGASESRMEWWARTSPIVVMSLILLAGSLFSFSRMGLMAPLIMTALFGLAWSSGSLSKRIGLVGTGVAGLALLLWSGAWRALSVLLDRFQTIEDSYRVAAWQGTYDLFRSSPVVGIGLGGLVDNLQRVLPMSIDEIFDHTHNEPLEILAEGGLIYAGLLVIGLVVYFGSVIPAWLGRRDPLARGLGWGCLVGVSAVFLHSLVEFPLRMPANAVWLSAILALGWTVTHSRAHPSADISRSGPLSWGRVFLIVPAGVGIGLSAVAMTGAALDRAGEGLVTRASTMVGEERQALLERAQHLHRNAHQFEPWQPAHIFKLGRAQEATAASLPALSEEAKAAWAAAAAAYRKATRLHPANARIQAALAWAELQSGNLPQATRAATAAVRLAPEDPQVLFAMSKWYFVQWEDLSSEEQRLAAMLIRRGAPKLPAEYVDAAWRFMRDPERVRELLPHDLRVRRVLLDKLTADQFFMDRWAEQETNPALRAPSPEGDLAVLTYGRLSSRRRPPIEAVSAGPWAGLVNDWLSAGLLASVEIDLPPGESVLYIPLRGEPAAGVWPIVHLNLNGKAFALPIMKDFEGGTAYVLVHSRGGIFLLQAVLANGAVVREHGGFTERRAALGLVRVLARRFQ